MTWKEICIVWTATAAQIRAGALADCFRAWVDLYEGHHPAFAEICEFLAEVLEAHQEQAGSEPRARQVRSNWRIIDNVARREVEQDLHEAGIIEDPSLDGGLNG